MYMYKPVYMYLYMYTSWATAITGDVAKSTTYMYKSTLTVMSKDKIHIHVYTG